MNPTLTRRELMGGAAGAMVAANLPMQATAAADGPILRLQVEERNLGG